MRGLPSSHNFEPSQAAMRAEAGIVAWIPSIFGVTTISCGFVPVEMFHEIARDPGHHPRSVQYG